MADMPKLYEELLKSAFQRGWKACLDSMRRIHAEQPSLSARTLLDIAGAVEARASDTSGTETAGVRVRSGSSDARP